MVSAITFLLFLPLVSSTSDSWMSLSRPGIMKQVNPIISDNNHLNTIHSQDHNFYNLSSLSSLSSVSLNSSNSYLLEILRHIPCNKLTGLTTSQQQLCHLYRDHMPFIGGGVRESISECQSQFKSSRWNCSTFDDDSVFGPILKSGSREAAFLYAMTSAGVVHAVTAACSAGNLTDCSCDRSRLGDSNTAEGWKWGGCSDNVRYGMMFAKHFIDAPDRQARRRDSGDLRHLMNLHNNQVGRVAVANNMELKCRCHGISGSCELKTCWRTLPSISIVGRLLKDKYETSVLISERTTRRRARKKGKVKRKVLVSVSKDDLVYVNKSPNFCVEDRSNGILGTTGRQCSKTSHGHDSCDLLCCGRGYNTRIKKITTRCDCIFKFCCSVQCSLCETETEVYTCK